MPDYIEFPLDTNPETLAEDAFDYLQANFPGWVPNDGNLDTIMVEAFARMVAETRDVASLVPVSIFKYYGGLVGIPSIQASFASALTNWTVINNAGYTIPAGTHVGLRTAGDVLVAYSTLADVIIPPGSTTATNVTVVAIEAGEDASGLGGAGTDLELLTSLDFVTLVELVGMTTGGTNAETEEEYLDRLSERLQLLAPRPILPRDFAIMAEDIAGVERAVALDGYNPDHNLLTANQSSLETDTTGWAPSLNSSIARDTAAAAHGVASLRIRSLAAGAWHARTDPNNIFPVTPGEQITAIASFKFAVTARNTQIGITWLTSGGAGISDSLSTSIAGSTSVFQDRSVTGTAPATAAYAQVVLIANGAAAANEDVYVDKIALRRGTSNVWAIGGTPAEGVEKMVTLAAVDEDGEAVSAPIKSDIDDYLQSHRETNFVVNIIDPLYTNIDVQFAAVAREGYDAASVEVQAETAVAEFLNPANWGFEGDTSQGGNWTNTKYVRYLELAQVINQVEGLDYITSLTFRIAGGSYATTDITLPGTIPLPRAGTIAGTVTVP